VGARNMQDFNLLRGTGRQSKPVLLKRGMRRPSRSCCSRRKYILAGGNYNVILCERRHSHIRDVYDATHDISAIPG